MISIARVRLGVNIWLTSLVTAVLLLGSIIVLPATAFAATADPNYTCGSYGGSSYNGCDTTINSGSSASSSSTSSTTPEATTTTTTTPTGNTVVNTNAQSGVNGAGKMSLGRKLMFVFFFLVFLLALWWFLLLFKRRKRKDEEPPATTDQNLWK